jgi:hypothetical protein
MPQHQYVAWLLAGPEDLAEVDQLFHAVMSFGIPFLKRVGSVSAITEHLMHGTFTYNESRQYRLPVALLLTGDAKQAVEAVNRFLEEQAVREDDFAQNYRGFAAALKRHAEGA